MKVKVNSRYIYYPNLLDLVDGRTGLKSGDVVRVINLSGAPKANTMNHCYVCDDITGEFIGMVHTNSLHTFTAYRDYLRGLIAQHEAAGRKPIPEHFASTNLRDFAAKV